MWTAARGTFLYVQFFEDVAFRVTGTGGGLL
jgi:hypothetical protein